MPTLIKRRLRQAPSEKRLELIAKAHNTCSLCQKIFTAQELEIDHIYPFSRGGMSEDKNYQVLCLSCNRKKIANDKKMPYLGIKVVRENRNRNRAIIAFRESNPDVPMEEIGAVFPHNGRPLTKQRVWAILNHKTCRNCYHQLAMGAFCACRDKADIMKHYCPDWFMKTNRS